MEEHADYQTIKVPLLPNISFYGIRVCESRLRFWDRNFEILTGNSESTWKIAFSDFLSESKFFPFLEKSRRLRGV